MAVEPFQDVGSLARIVRPAGRDHAQPAARRLARFGWMKDRRVDGVVNDDRVPQLEPELLVLVEAVAGLQDGRGGELLVHLHDAAVSSVVETAVRTYRAVDPMHHADATASKAPQPLVVEVEGIEEARSRSAGEPIDLDREAAAFPLPD